MDCLREEEDIKSVFRRKRYWKRKGKRKVMRTDMGTDIKSE